MKSKYPPVRQSREGCLVYVATVRFAQAPEHLSCAQSRPLSRRISGNGKWNFFDVRKLLQQQRRQHQLIARRWLTPWRQGLLLQQLLDAPELLPQPPLVWRTSRQQVRNLVLHVNRSHRHVAPSSAPTASFQPLRLLGSKETGSHRATAAQAILAKVAECRVTSSDMSG